VSTNLSTILVGLGYDLSALEKGAPEAFRLINSQTLGMSAEMKRASREGAESLRLIDESLGIHLSRPLTRILTQEFPALATGLQSVLGVGITGVLATAGFEFIEKALHKVEEAQKDEEEAVGASKKVYDLVAEGGQHYAEALEMIHAKLAAVGGDSSLLHHLEQMRELGANVEDTRKRIEQLGAAMETEAKAAEKAGSINDRIWSAIGDIPENLANFHAMGNPGLQKMLDDQENARQARVVGSDMKEDVNQAFLSDKASGKNTAGPMIEEDLKRIDAEFKRMVASGNEAGAAIAAGTQHWLEQSKEWAGSLQKLNEEQGKLQVAQDAAAAMEKQRAAIQADDAATEKFAQSLVKLHSSALPAKDAFAQFDDEVLKQTISFTRLQALIGDQAFYIKFHKSLQDVLADMRVFDGMKLTPPEIKMPIPPGAGPTLPPPPSAAPVAPQLGSGGTAGTQLSVFNADQGAQLKLAAQAYQDAMTPAARYQVAVGELSTLLQKGLIDQTAYTAAVQKAGDAMEQADKKLIHARDGLKSFFAEMQQDSNTGRFTFDILSQGMKGFEDQVTESLTNGKMEWQKYFLSLDQMALKFTLNKEMTGLFKDFSSTNIGKSLMGLVQTPAQQAATTQTNIGSDSDSSGFSPFAAGKSLMSSFQGGASQTTAATTQLNAGTLMQTAANNQLAAAQMMASSTNGGVGGVPSGDDGSSSSSSLDLSDSGSYGEYASGSDYTPGGMALVGEDGPEMVNLPTGSSVTPNSQMRFGTVHNIFQIDAKGAEIGVEEKIARAISKSAPQMIMRAVTASSEISKRSLSRG
jgi:hypothetical protein